MATEYLAGTISVQSSASARLDSELLPYLAGSVSVQSGTSGRLQPLPYFDKVDTHSTQAIAHLLEQFKGKPILEALLTVFVNQVQEIEDALWDLFLKRSLDMASGEQLDGMGAILGEARQDRSDDDYKRGIYTRIMINFCEGTPEEVIEILERYSESEVTFREYYPAEFILTVLDALDSADLDSDGSPDAAERLGAYLQDCKPAAVGASLVYGISESSELFRFDSGPGYDLGKYAGVI